MTLPADDHVHSEWSWDAAGGGVEIGERHWFKAQTPALVANGAYERVLGSLHALLVGDEPWFVGTLLGPNAPTRLTPHMVMRSYLLEALRMIEADSSFTVLAHLDYPMRAWPQSAAPFDPRTLEDRYRSLAQGASIIVGGS